MRVTLRAFASCREALGTDSLEVALPKGATLRSLLQSLKPKGLDLLDGDRLRGETNVLVNGEQVEYGKGLDTVLKEGDEVAVFPPVAGG